MATKNGTESCEKLANFFCPAAGRQFFLQEMFLPIFIFFCQKFEEKRNSGLILPRKKELKGISIPLKEKKEFSMSRIEKKENKGKKGTARALQMR